MEQKRITKECFNEDFLYWAGPYERTLQRNECTVARVRYRADSPAGSVGATSSALIKEAVLGFHPVINWWSTGCLSHRWWKCRVPKVFGNELCWALHTWSLLDRMVFGPVHSCFLSGRLVLEGAQRSSACCYHHVVRLLVPWWSQLAENVMDAEICGLAMVVRVFVAMWIWLGDSWFGATTL
jgi:hypothetical protein